LEDFSCILSVSGEAVKDEAFVHASGRVNFRFDDFAKDLLGEAGLQSVAIKIGVLLLSGLLVSGHLDVLKLFESSLDLSRELVISALSLLNHIEDLQMGNTVCLSELGGEVSLA